MEQRWNDTDREKPKDLACPGAALPTNFTLIVLGTKAGRRGEKPTTNRL
jgi:hypothetical protein